MNSTSSCLQRWTRMHQWARLVPGFSGGFGFGTGRSKGRPVPGRGGFTLVEVLVALAIISVGLLAALRTAGEGTGNVGELRSRLLAGWVAENRLAEHRARGAWLPLGIHRGREREAGIEFAWREEVIATPNPAFRRIDVFVFAAPGESRALAHYSGFVVNPPATVK